MSRNKLIEMVEQPYLRKETFEIPIGATVDVYTKIVEGDKERIQVFNGVVIAKKGTGVNETFTVRRIVANQGVERIFMVHSPRVMKVEVKRLGKVRRAKLFYLRDRVGKARRLREKRRIVRSDSKRPTTNDAAPRTVGTDSSESAPVAVAGQPA